MAVQHMSVEQRRAVVAELKPGQRVRVYYDVGKSKSAVCSVVSVRKDSVVLSGGMAASRYSREYLASVLVDVLS